MHATHEFAKWWSCAALFGSHLATGQARRLEGRPNIVHALVIKKKKINMFPLYDLMQMH